ncbi:uncharacterized protein KY384_001765 [Bacidia gigantensis]|uniref:uncharacterized protein n=1 Tax=Bacidia gigantensis TaxID=2732470 RepID=UPI001D03BD7D|nr:uncharacterized protein KY384_001765 [Bacidia gigantensis]KAG8532983.1 hypothetical protein KY384_001765 [Bacidia gigantensis]
MSSRPAPDSSDSDVSSVSGSLQPHSPASQREDSAATVSPPPTNPAGAKKPRQPAQRQNRLSPSSDITNTSGDEDESDRDSEREATNPPSPQPNSKAIKPSTWRKRNADAISISHGQDKVTARDLSVHLYNAFKLRHPAPNPTGSIGKGKDKEWVPPKHWTAWPLSADRVPRPDFMPRDKNEREWWEGEDSDDGKGKGRGGERRMPYPYLPRLIKKSEEMEEVLLAIMLKEGKERWERRESASTSSSEEDENEEVDNRGGSAEKEKSGPNEEREDPTEATEEGSTAYETGDQSSGSENSESQPSRHASSREPSEDEGVGDESAKGERMEIDREAPTIPPATDLGDNELSDPTPFRHAKPDTKTTYTYTDEEYAGMGNKEMRPVIMADDTLAMDILKPSIRHILSQLNNLLCALHVSRASYAGVPGADLSGTSMSRSQSRARSTSRTPADSRQVSRKRARSAATTSDDEDGDGQDGGEEEEEEEEGGTASSVGERLHQRKLRLNTRGWEDILGAAEMVGFPREVVGRARERCEGLFGPGELGVGGHDDGDSDSMRESDDVEVDGRRVYVNKEGEDMLDGIHLDGWLQPIQEKRSWKVKGKGKEEKGKGKDEGIRVKIPVSSGGG